MSRRASAVIVTLVLLGPAFGMPVQDAAAMSTVPAHACCLRLGAAMHCRTLAFTCCPTREQRSETTPPTGATAGGSPLVPVQGDHIAAAATPDAVGALAAHEHSLARLKAPPGPLYLTHLSLLV